MQFFTKTVKSWLTSSFRILANVFRHRFHVALARIEAKVFCDINFPVNDELPRNVRNLDIDLLFYILKF